MTLGMLIKTVYIFVPLLLNFVKKKKNKPKKQNKTCIGKARTVSCMTQLHNYYQLKQTFSQPPC